MNTRNDSRTHKHITNSPSHLSNYQSIRGLICYMDLGADINLMFYQMLIYLAGTLFSLVTYTIHCK